MLNSAITQNAGITIDNFDLLEGGLTQAHSLVNFLFINDNHHEMPKQMFLNLLALASTRIAKSIVNSQAIFSNGLPDEQPQITAQLEQVRLLLDALHISDEVANTSLNEQSNLLWLVSDCLEEAKSELGRIPII